MALSNGPYWPNKIPAYRTCFFPGVTEGNKNLRKVSTSWASATTGTLGGDAVIVKGEKWGF